MIQPDQLVITCPACAGRLRAPRSSIGTTVGCPTCKSGVPVRDPAALIAPDMIVDPSRKLGAFSRAAPHSPLDDDFRERLRHTTEETYQVDPDNPVMKRRDIRKQKHGQATTDWEGNHHRRRRSRSRRAVLALSLTAAVLVTLIGGIFWQRIRRFKPQPPPPPVTTTVESRFREQFHDEIWETIRKFCTAPTAADLLPWIRDPGRVGPKLIKYYNSDNPWIPFSPGSRPDFSAVEIHQNFLICQIPLKDYSSVPLGLEKTPDGFRVDWESFTGYSDLSWADLRRTRPRDPVVLRAVLRPSDYFNLDFPSATTHRCYQLSDQGHENVVYGYVPAGGPVDLRIKQTLLTAREIYVVLEVRYPGTSTNDRQLEITAVLQKGWIFRPDDLPPPPAGDPAPTAPLPPATPSPSTDSTTPLPP